MLIGCVNLVSSNRYRNTWIWGCTHEGCGPKPKLEAVSGGGGKNPLLVRGSHETLGEYYWAVEQVSERHTHQKPTLWKLIITYNHTKEFYPLKYEYATVRLMLTYVLLFLQSSDGDGEAPVNLLFTENETNSQRLFGTDNYTLYVKDAFHRYVVNG